MHSHFTGSSPRQQKTCPTSCCAECFYSGLTNNYALLGTYRFNISAYPSAVTEQNLIIRYSHALLGCLPRSQALLLDFARANIIRENLKREILVRNRAQMFANNVRAGEV